MATPVKDQPPEDEGRIHGACQELMRRVQMTLGTTIRSLDSMRTIEAIVTTHRRECFQKGIVFPRLRVVFVHCNDTWNLEMIRRDLDEENVKNFLANLTVNYAGITPQELRAVILRHFQDYELKNFDLEPKTKKLITADYP